MEGKDIELFYTFVNYSIEQNKAITEHNKQLVKQILNIKRLVALFGLFSISLIILLSGFMYYLFLLQ